jgi:hypothetical protein
MRGRLIMAVLLILVGAVWIGQGTGVLTGESFMVGDPVWAIIGLALVAAGIAMAVIAWRRRQPAP